MKKLVTLSALASAMLLATNGDIMIGNGAKSTSMGGVGIALSHGAEVVNPAMLKDVKGREVAASATLFLPDVNFQNTMDPRLAYASSETDSSVIPTLAYASRVNDNFVYGFSVVGAAGMGVDYVGKMNGAFNMNTALQIAKISIPMAYTLNNFTIGIEPVLQYGTLDMNYQTPQGASNNKEATSTAFGYNIGLAYSANGFTIGAVYKSAIEAEYDNVIANATRDFQLNQAITSGDKLEQPVEMGVGIAYTQNEHTIAVDYKQIKWGDATGYSDFGWEDQNVLAVGYRYAKDGVAFKLGYNHGENPIGEQSASAAGLPASYVGGGVNFFNIAGFPAVVEDHYTLGVDYDVNKNLTITSAFVYTPEVEVSYDISSLAAAFTQGQVTSASANVIHAQTAFTLGVVYKF